MVQGPDRGRSLYFGPVNAEFNWWLLIVGIVVGAGLVWFVLMDSRRREADLDETEHPLEAAWLSATLAAEGWDVPPEAAARVLELHRDYLDAPPPDEVRADETAMSDPEGSMPDPEAGGAATAGPS